MSRPPRKSSSTGLYHVISRGLNRQNIFEEDIDFRKFIEFLKIVKVEMDFEIYAYCLMNNHVHLLLKEHNTRDITKIMIKLLTSYVGWYNKKYQRSGSLIGNRYKSEPIEDEQYFFAAVRYIHQNPMRAGSVRQLSDYQWSSYNEYFNKSDLVDTHFILNLLSEDDVLAKEQFRTQHFFKEENSFTISDGKRLTDEQVARRISIVLEVDDVRSIATKPKGERNMLLTYLKEKECLSIAQIERVTGIPRGIISRCNNVTKKARPQNEH